MNGEREIASAPSTTASTATRGIRANTLIKSAYCRSLSARSIPLRSTCDMPARSAHVFTLRLSAKRNSSSSKCGSWSSGLRLSHNACTSMGMRRMVDSTVSNVGQRATRPAMRICVSCMHMLIMSATSSGHFRRM